jgi:apolipoprotein N-acyltransferase
LVPFGEYIPFRQIIPFEKLVPIPFDFKAGKELKTIRTAGTPPFGALVCYEVIFSGHVVSKTTRPTWLVNVTNDGWYGHSAGPYQHLGMAKMRAVEEGLPLARVANTGISAVFDGYGQTIGQLPLGTEGVLDTTLPMPLQKTIYSCFGYWLPVSLLTLLLLFLCLKRK